MADSWLCRQLTIENWGLHSAGPPSNYEIISVNSHVQAVFGDFSPAIGGPAGSHLFGLLGPIRAFRSCPAYRAASAFFLQHPSRSKDQPESAQAQRISKLRRADHHV